MKARYVWNPRKKPCCLSKRCSLGANIWAAEGEPTKTHALRNVPQNDTLQAFSLQHTGTCNVQQSVSPSFYCGTVSNPTLLSLTSILQYRSSDICYDLFFKSAKVFMNSWNCMVETCSSELHFSSVQFWVICVKLQVLHHVKLLGSILWSLLTNYWKDKINCICSWACSSQNVQKKCQ